MATVVHSTSDSIVGPAACQISPGSRAGQHGLRLFREIVFLTRFLHWMQRLSSRNCRHGECVSLKPVDLVQRCNSSGEKQSMQAKNAVIVLVLFAAVSGWSQDSTKPAPAE